MINPMRSAGLFFTFLLLAGVAAIPHLAHAAIPFLGPIVPDTNNLCADAWGMVIIVVNNLIEFGITLAIVFVAPITIAYAGFLMVTEPMSPGGHTKARDILLNTVVGIVIALAAWLIVDAVMATLTPNGMPFGENWATIISSNNAPLCIPLPATLNQTASGVGISGVSAAGVNYLAPVSGNCSTSALISDGINPAIANTMSCIAQKESSCNLTASNNSSSAFGLFQIVNGYNDTGHNLNFPACSQAVKMSGNLNCSQGVIAGGKPNPQNISLYNTCRAASSNAQCNAAAAQWLYNQAGGFSPWVTAGQCGA